ncbi:hypothetical protein CKO36_05890 [Rhabdochromatium marinum]|nr:hypothetical protein [Rhabdochromatium marinum]
MQFRKTFFSIKRLKPTQTRFTASRPDLKLSALLRADRMSTRRLIGRALHQACQPALAKPNE